MRDSTVVYIRGPMIKLYDIRSLNLYEPIKLQGFSADLVIQEDAEGVSENFTGHSAGQIPHVSGSDLIDMQPLG